MRKNISLIELIVVLSVIVIIVKGLTYKKPFKHEQISVNTPTNELSAEFWNYKGVLLCDQGKYKEALKYFDKAIEINPEYPYAFFNKADILAKLGNYEDSNKYREKAMELFQKNAEAEYKLEVKKKH